MEKKKRRMKMGSKNNNMSKEAIKDTYRNLISKFENEGKNPSALVRRLGELNKKEAKKSRLGIATMLLRKVITEVTDFQDTYDISLPLYKEIIEFIDE